MIDREDMLELTRRMTPSRTSVSRIAGAYMTSDGEIDGTFHTHFLKLSAADKEKNLAVAREVLFSRTNDQLKEYAFSAADPAQAQLVQLLDACLACELKNDALLETFYELVGETYHSTEDYAVYVFYGCYDVPRKASDKAEQWESEEVYRYLIATIGPFTEDYEAELPDCGFLYPSFANHSTHNGYAAVYQRDPLHPHSELQRGLLGITAIRHGQ